MEREGTAVTCDGRLFHRRAAVTGNALSPTVDRRVRRTSRDVDEAERIVVVWLECLLVDVFRHTGTLSPVHADICTPNGIRFPQRVTFCSGSTGKVSPVPLAMFTIPAGVT